MKWKTTGVAGDWCDTRLLSALVLDICIKGVPVCPGAGPAVNLWRRWPDAWSPNCPLVLQSMIPGLVHKAVHLHGTRGSLADPTMIFG